MTKYIPQAPTPPQRVFLACEGREALYGGAAGGGKSSALLMAALQYVDVAGYAALVLRRTYADLALPGALIPRSHEWLRGTDATWNEQAKRWTFPSGATLTFGYLENSSDVYRYQGSEFQAVFFDELTQLEERSYRYLFSRLRRLEGSKVPLRVRGASNPGGVGHAWVRNRFLVEGPACGRVFVPARLEDNPHLDRGEYEASLQELDDVTRRQLLLGDWSATDSSMKLVPEWTEAVAAQCTREEPWPEYFTPYVVGDLGSRDLTVWLFAVYDFQKGRVHVVDELVLKDPSTKEMVDGVRAKEAQLWGKHPGAQETVRRSDVDWRLVKDFEAEGVELRPTKKDDGLGTRNTTRKHLQALRYVISPKCRTLLLTLESAVWNDKRTDYQRTEGTGHADAWDALVYLDRNVQWDLNPQPVTEYEPGSRWLREVRPPQSKQQKALVSIFGPKR